MGGRKGHPPGRSKLTDAQWKEIELRLKSGESKRGVAKDYDISEHAIRQHFPGDKYAAPRKVAFDIVEACTPTQYEKAIKELKSIDKDSRIVAVTMMDELQQISSNLLKGSVKASETFQRLQTIAAGRVVALNDSSPPEALKEAVAYSMAANISAEAPLKILAANKTRVDAAEAAAQSGPAQIVADDAADAAREYMRIICGPS